MKSPALIWFRRDLRIQDNPALAAAVASGAPVLPVYIHAPDEEAPWSPGGASCWWLHHALAALANELRAIGLPLIIRRGSSEQTLGSLLDETGARSVYWNRLYEPAVIARDSHIKTSLRQLNVDVRSFNAALLFEPHEIRNQSGKPFRVFTPFWKHIQRQNIPIPVEAEQQSVSAPQTLPRSDNIDDLGLLPRLSWAEGFFSHWNPTSQAAWSRLETFAADAASSYADQRDLPGVDGTSGLSPYLHFGQISPRQIWQAMREAGADANRGGLTFLSEVAWRDFAHHLLFHFPETPWQSMQAHYRQFPYQPDAGFLDRWQRGETGYPIVDAGMRQLWHSGWMHNRVRMIVASFLVKHLLQPWQEGAGWFWDTLVDADLASNTMGWQWTAGCGADAAPYFRVFNPILQGEKFDPDGNYVRRWIPALSKVPSRFVHQPWEAGSAVLDDAKLLLGRDYPQPVIEHRRGRERALAALAANKALRAETE